jgi:hypothetical protein
MSGENCLSDRSDKPHSQPAALKKGLLIVDVAVPFDWYWICGLHIMYNFQGNFAEFNLKIIVILPIHISLLRVIGFDLMMSERRVVIFHKFDRKALLTQ